MCANSAQKCNWTLPNAHQKSACECKSLQKGAKRCRAWIPKHWLVMGLKFPYHLIWIIALFITWKQLPCTFYLHKYCKSLRGVPTAECVPNVDLCMGDNKMSTTWIDELCCKRCKKMQKDEFGNWSTYVKKMTKNKIRGFQSLLVVSYSLYDIRIQYTYRYKTRLSWHFFR